MGKDPALTALGQQRALALSKLLVDANIDYVHSSDYTRTKLTAAPTSAKLALHTQIYNPHDLASLVKDIRLLGGRHMVVGHSNTIPQTVALLGGDPGGDIEESEFDRLYIVTLTDELTASTVLLHY